MLCTEITLQAEVGIKRHSRPRLTRAQFLSTASACDRSTVVLLNLYIAKMTEASSTEPKKERFAPKVPVQLDPPKYDPITLDYLAKCDGTCSRIIVEVSYDLI